MATPTNTNSLLAFLQSPGGAALINGAGGLLTGLGQSKQAAADRQQQAAQLAQQVYSGDQAQRLTEASGTLSARPLGANQQFAQRQAILNAILPNLRNFSVTAGDPAVAAATGQVSGGFKLPENGFGSDVLKLFSPEATASSIAQRDADIFNLNPNAARTSFSSMGFDPSISNAQEGYLSNFQSQVQGRQDTARKQRDDALSRALNGQVEGSGGGGTPWWKKALGLGAMAIPFIGPAVGMGVLGTTLASGALGGLSGGVSGAAQGALGGYMGAKSYGKKV